MVNKEGFFSVTINSMFKLKEIRFHPNTPDAKVGQSCQIPRIDIYMLE